MMIKICYYSKKPTELNCQILKKLDLVISPSADIGVINTGTTSFNLTNAKLDIVRTGNF